MTGPPGRPDRNGGPQAAMHPRDRHYHTTQTVEPEVMPSVAELLDLSDERDQWVRRVLAAWRDGYAAGRDSMADAVTTAFIDGLLRRKRIEHNHIRALTGGTDRVDLWQDQQARTWGPGGREHFADPRPGDFQGRQHG